MSFFLFQFVEKFRQQQNTGFPANVNRIKIKYFREIMMIFGKSVCDGISLSIKCAQKKGANGVI